MVHVGCFCLALIIFAVLLGAIFWLLNTLAPFRPLRIRSRNSRWFAESEYSPQHGLDPAKYYWNPMDNYILKPGNFRRLPWARKTFFRFPLFNSRYITRPILDQAL